MEERSSEEEVPSVGELEDCIGVEGEAETAAVVLEKAGTIGGA